MKLSSESYALILYLLEQAEESMGEEDAPRIKNALSEVEAIGTY